MGETKCFMRENPGGEPKDQLAKLLKCSCASCLKFQESVRAGKVKLPRPLSYYGLKEDWLRK